jgi:pimeloyl-ACP methyl ester carboxylesterase
MTNYRTLDVAVPGGALHAGVWESDDVAAGAEASRVALALHGVTANHLSWAVVAQALTAAPGVRVLAPDLRGRGRSNGLPGPWGMPRHADDAAFLLDAAGAGAVAVVGHSMGGFAAAVFAHRHADRTRSLLLVDGGPPLPLPEGMTPAQLLAATLGPAEARLRMTFASRQAYLEFWRPHPALAGDWSEAVEAYLEHDLVGTEPELRSSCRYEAIAADSAELVDDGSVLAAWSALPVPARFLRAPRGLLNGDPLYAVAALEQWQQRVPDFSWRDVEDVNHYTITLSRAGAAAVAGEVFVPA